MTDELTKGESGNTDVSDKIKKIDEEMDEMKKDIKRVREE